MNLIDMHCDTIWKLMETNGTTLKDNPFCVDLQKLKRAKSTAQFFACFIYQSQSHEIFWNLTKIRRRENFPLF